jgi:catechol-2,3-dioxygenase
MPYVYPPDDKSTAALRPKAFCHIVLRTTAENYKGMLDFWTGFLGGDLYYTENISFVRIDEAHHRVGIMIDRNLDTAERRMPGLDHVAFGYNTAQEFASAYKERKMKGYGPVWCTNHGPATSMYYSDPDGNHIEILLENFDKMEDAVAFMDSEAFTENPIGVDYDPDEFVRRVEAGESEESMKKRPDIGSRREIPETYMAA